MEVMSAKWYLTGSTGVVTVITFLGCVAKFIEYRNPWKEVSYAAIPKISAMNLTLISNRALGNSLNLFSDNLSMETSANGHTSHPTIFCPSFRSTTLLRSWLRPHRGILKQNCRCILAFLSSCIMLGSEERLCFQPSLSVFSRRSLEPYWALTYIRLLKAASINLLKNRC